MREKKRAEVKDVRSYDIVALVKWAKVKHPELGIELSVQSKGKIGEDLKSV